MRCVRGTTLKRGPRTSKQREQSKKRNNKKLSENKPSSGLVIYSRSGKDLKVDYKTIMLILGDLSMVLLIMVLMIILRMQCNGVGWETNSLLGYRSRRKGGGGQRRFNYLSHFTFCVINLQHNFGTSVQDSYTPNVTQIDFCRKMSKQRKKREKYRLKILVVCKLNRHGTTGCFARLAQHGTIWHGGPVTAS